MSHTNNTAVTGWLSNYPIQRWPKWAQLLMHVGVFLSVAVGQFALFNFSFNYVVIPSFVIWYFPLGFQFIIFIFLPYRYWPMAILAICVASGATMQFQGSIYYDLLKHFLQSILMTISTLPFIYYAREKQINQSLFTLRSIALIIFLGMLTRFASVGYFVISETSVYDKVAAKDTLDIFVLHNLAAYPGLLFAISIFLIVQWLLQHNTALPNFSRPILLRNLVLLSVGIVAFYHFSAFTQQLLMILLFLPIVWFGYRLSWFGSLSCALWINTVLLLLLYQAPAATLLQFQPFIIAYFAVGLITAALQLEHSRLQTEQLANQRTLQTHNQQLLALQSSLQELSKQVVFLEEQEKKRLSQELHDDIGQNIIALKTIMRLLKRQLNMIPQEQQLLKEMTAISDDVYNNIYELMHWLRPRVVDDFGLYHAISGTFYQERLAMHNITYTSDVHIAVDQLPDEQKITLFRIIQECVNNTIEHSHARSCQVTLHYVSDRCQLHIWDDGDGFPASVLAGQYGSGLFNIQTYVTALGGTLALSNHHGGHVYVTLVN